MLTLFSRYPLGGDAEDLACDDSKGFGLLAIAYFGTIIVVGALILPTMLIGVVAINFEQATAKFENELSDKVSTHHVDRSQDQSHFSRVFCRCVSVQ